MYLFVVDLEKKTAGLNCPVFDNQILNVVETLDFNSKTSIIIKIRVALSLHSCLVSIILRLHPTVKRNKGSE